MMSYGVQLVFFILRETLIYYIKRDWLLDSLLNPAVAPHWQEQVDITEALLSAVSLVCFQSLTFIIISFIQPLLYIKMVSVLKKSDHAGVW